MPKVITPRQWEVYENRRKRGFSIRLAAADAKISESTAKRRELQLNALSPGERPGYRDATRHREPVPLNELGVEAKRALGDFTYFQERYLGRIATPWQAEAAGLVLERWKTADKEFEVVNAPPGVGKSTCFTLDIPLWLTCRNRALRGMIGSKVASSATRYVQRIKRHLSMTVPYQPESELIAKGLAVDAVATLADDFGSFRPEERDVWSADAFVVAQHAGRLIAEKEPTWSAFGMDSGFLGMRYEIIIWDDLVDKLVMRTPESRANQQEWWDDVAEKRLEPGGVLILQGQRMGADDLYRYSLDKRTVSDDVEEDEMVAHGVQGVPKYHHIVFKAHYEDRCDGSRERHSVNAPYYPDGCLLDPRRAPWRELRQEMSNPRHNFAVIYQQEDADPESVLVDPQWVYGGVDSKTGMVFPGCVDRERATAELEPGLAGDLLSIATADPSPTQFWSVQWWIVRCVDGKAHERYLMDLRRQKMSAADFLDWREQTRSFMGLMEDWQQRSIAVGHPIRHWIVERNGAQRFMLQYDHMRRWLAEHRVDLIPHDTTTNKSDPEYGVQTLASIYKYGLVRLPLRTNTDAAYNSLKLIEEVTKYPGFKTDDCVMAQWFLEWRLPSLIPSGGGLPVLTRPSWLSKVKTYEWREAWRKVV